jgi:hypothetical protein
MRFRGPWQRSENRGSIAERRHAAWNGAEPNLKVRPLIELQFADGALSLLDGLRHSDRHFPRVYKLNHATPHTHQC